MQQNSGGFCAMNLALRHPDLYGAAASLSGYFTAITDHTTGDLYKGNQQVRNENSPLWRVRNLPVPAMPVFLSTAADDHGGYQQLQEFAAAVKPPMQAAQLIVPTGGHTGAVWREVLPAVFDWFAGWLAAPDVSPVPVAAKPVPTHGPVRQGFGPCVPGSGCPAKPPGPAVRSSGNLGLSTIKRR